MYVSMLSFFDRYIYVCMYITTNAFMYICTYKLLKNGKIDLLVKN